MNYIKTIMASTLLVHSIVYCVNKSPSPSTVTITTAQNLKTLCERMNALIPLIQKQSQNITDPNISNQDIKTLLGNLNSLQSLSDQSKHYITSIDDGISSIRNQFESIAQLIANNAVE